MGFPGGSKNPPAKAADMGSIPGPRRSPGEGNGSPLQYSCLENPMDREGLQSGSSKRVRESLVTKQQLNTAMEHDIRFKTWVPSYLQEVNRITFSEVYLVEILSHYLINNNHFSLSCFTVGFTFRCNWKAPGEISSRARIIRGHLSMQPLDCLDHGDPQCQRPSNFLHLP